MLTLGACASPAAIPDAVAPEVPQALRACPATPAAVPAPVKPRGFDAVVAWGNASDARRAETAHALEVCRQKLIELRAWTESR